MRLEIAVAAFAALRGKRRISVYVAEVPFSSRATYDTCPYQCRTTFRHDKNDSGLTCLHDIRRFSRSRLPRDSAESA